MGYHIERVNSLIRQTISEMLTRQVKDPRLGNFISITAVDTSADMKHAKVYVSCLLGGDGKQDDESRAETLSVLSSAAGFFRREMASNLKLRRIPELTFQWDKSIERGDQVLRIIDNIVPVERHPDSESSTLD
ncbi:MAG TPA: 30S ribosome-binding factor RbfA [Dehalococcoidia bacterium]|nr:30S ribosome-binding factor RbfA [Dehalococcoidia bacterium]